MSALSQTQEATMKVTTRAKTFPDRIHELLPRIRERREEIEGARRLPGDIVEELGRAGVFSLGIPKALGGEEADGLDLFRAIEAISAADGSTGWCAMLGIGSGIVAGYMRDEGAREVFTNRAVPKALVAEPAGAAVRSNGGVTVSGRWRFASGVTHSDWIVAGCVVMENGQPRMTPHGPEVVHVFMPTSDVQIHDTWHVSGLCGTGSNDVSCADVFVPERRVLSLFFPDARPEPLYQMPVLTHVAPAIAIVAVGIARAALDEIKELASTKVPSLSTGSLAEKPVAQIETARAEGELGAARSFLYETVDEVWQCVVAGNQPTLEQRSLCRIASNQATEVAARVARMASTLGGSNSVFNSSSLQRHARDADVITHHFTQSPHVWQDAGRAMLGMEPQAPLF
jgi:alkylation response protein AidB-like acyl-CoA dehydrogenase